MGYDVKVQSSVAGKLLKVHWHSYIRILQIHFQNITYMKNVYLQIKEKE